MRGSGDRCDDFDVGFHGDVALVGRERELAILRDVVRRAAEGEPGAVLVAGEAGVGKSRLLRELLDDPAHPEALVLRVQCVDLGDPGLPYLALIDLLRGLQGLAATDSEISAVLDQHPVVTGLTDPDTSRDGPVDESRRLQLFDGAAAMLAEVGRIRGPVVVAIEDLQWVDSSSAEFLRFLLSRMIAERLTVVATVRTDGLGTRPRIRQLLNEVGRLPSVQRLDLDPFDESEVADYLARVKGSPQDAGVTDEVFRRTGGNPFYVQTLAGSIGRTGRVDEGVPRALADLLVGRLDSLPDDAQTVVRCASIVAHPVPDRLLRQVVGLDDAAMDEALRIAVAAGLLAPDDSGYIFAHDLLRTAVYDDLLPGVRARLHAAHAAALETGGARSVPPAEVAHHFTVAQDAPKTLVWSLRAAEEATEVLAPDEALHHLERALAEWPNVGGASALAGISEGQVAARAARAAGLAGEPTRAVEWARQAVELSDPGEDPAGSVQARAELGRQLLAVDAGDRAVRAAEEAVRIADAADVGASPTALARVVLARALILARRTDDAHTPVERALVEAQAAGVPGLEVEALTTAAFLAEIEGDREAATQRLGAALQLAKAEGELAAELRAHYALASLHYYNGDIEGSLPVLRAAVTRATESGLRWSNHGVELRVLHVVALYVSGGLDGSLEAAEAFEGRPPDVAAARLAAVSCYAAVARGLDDAELRFDRLRDSWEADPQVGLVAGGCEADHLSWQGEFAASAAMAERAQIHLDTVAGEGMYGGLWLSALGLAALADEAAYCRQRRDDAGVAAAVERGEILRQRVERIAAGGHGRPGDLGPEGHAWHTRALAEHARLLGDPAVELWERALDAYGFGHAYEQARCRWRLAEACLAAGDRDAARIHADAAAVAAAEMRAAPLQRAVAATVSGARLAGSATAGDGVLTEREREVLELVAEGLTNREIGARLFISAKTASVHLSNVMAKLNAASRTEAVTVAQRRGLLDVIGPDRPTP